MAAIQLNLQIHIGKAGDSVGLSLIPERDIVQVRKKEVLDSWGLQIKDSSTIQYKGNVKGHEDSTPITSEGGKQVIPTYSVSFNGSPDISVGDFIIIYGEEFQVLTKKRIRDLLGNIIYIKVSV